MKDEAHPTPLRRPEWPRPAASAAIFKGSEVLLVQRGKGNAAGLWSLPGGHIEPGETASAAAAREVAEETGVTAHIVGIVGVHDVFIRNGAGVLVGHYVIAVHHGRYVDGVPRAASDAAAARFVSFSEVPSLPQTPSLHDFIQRAARLR